MGKLCTAVTILFAPIGLPAVPAAACSVYVPSFEEVMANDFRPSAELTGWFEAEVVATAPSILYRHERSVSVVTRYWGDESEITGRQVHGAGGLSEEGCGDHTGTAGGLYYGLTFEDDEGRFSDRGLNLITGTAALGEPLDPADEARIVERFGRPTDLEITGGTRRLATLSLWAGPTVIVLVLAMLGLVAVIARRRPTYFGGADPTGQTDSPKPSSPYYTVNSSLDQRSGARRGRH